MALAAAWIDQNWIYSHDPSVSGKYWIDDNWIWGPLGGADVNTGHWIDNTWIWGPVTRSSISTRFWIDKGFIFGPSKTLPFTPEGLKERGLG